MLEKLLPKDYLAPLAQRFEIIKILGYGGMGVCYLAEDITQQKKYALKVLHPDLHDNPEAIMQIKKEAVLEQKFQNHPHIVTTYDFIEFDQIKVKVMEVISAFTLKDYLKQIVFNPEELQQKMMHAMTAALTSIHTQGILHCDLKPANIFIDTKGTIKLFDFGIARLRHETTPKNFSAYSPRYASPSIRAGNPPTTEDDFYSLKIIANEIRTSLSRER